MHLYVQIQTTKPPHRHNTYVHTSKAEEERRKTQYGSFDGLGLLDVTGNTLFASQHISLF